MARSSAPNSGANADTSTDDTSTGDPSTEVDTTQPDVGDDTPSGDTQDTKTDKAATPPAEDEEQGPNPYDPVRVRHRDVEYTTTRSHASKHESIKVLEGKKAVDDTTDKALSSRVKPDNRTDLAGNPANQEA